MNATAALAPPAPPTQEPPASGPWTAAATNSDAAVWAGDDESEGIAHASWEHGEASAANFAHIARHDPARVLAECEAKRRIVEFHKSWPVLVETPPTFSETDSTDVNAMTLRMTQQIAWTIEQQYREQFGSEPPTGPILRALAAVYADHPDYREEWRP